MTTKIITETRRVHTPEDLKQLLDTFSPLGEDAKFVSVCRADGGPVAARLEETTLTDGSKTYEIRFL